MNILCRNLLTTDGLKENIVVALDSDGCVTGITDEKSAKAKPEQTLDGLVVPGFQNSHSHAFQYGMAGLAEHLSAGAKQDDFWSWRNTMYKLANRVDPEQMEAVASMLYAELLRQGTTHVVEFHYLHHDKGGKAYDNASEMSERLMQAAKNTGMGLTIAPVFYHNGGFGKPANELQKRFIFESSDAYLRIVETTKKSSKNYQDVFCGIGVHSLRAANPDQIATIVNHEAAAPFHIHIAEQSKEVDDCIATLGKRPVAWLLDSFDINHRFHLTHATHMTSDETTRLAKSGATAVICPSTEGNLGDGFFNLSQYRAQNGSYAIGTDSHIGLNIFEELRWLDYAQRLREEKRNIICNEPGQRSADTLVRETWLGGRRAAGLDASEYYAKGQPFDVIELDQDHCSLIAKPKEHWLSAALYASDSSVIKKIVRRGKTIVEQQKHVNFEKIKVAYIKAIKELTE